MPIINPGFNPKTPAAKLPPGQSQVMNWPVLTYGPTPRTATADWSLVIDGEVEQPLTLSWADFNALPAKHMVTDIHCVTHWSRLGMPWDGVALEELIERAGGLKPTAKFLLAACDGGYTTNLPLADVMGGQAMVATKADGTPLPAEHGGPARLFVPHLYFWKSAKWVRRLTFSATDQPGFWEVNGYHNHGDPWKEERYSDG
ncbi:MAG TPA: sulfite oxidase-like oxidoreductase [Candidatus Saccharimonas sp.]|nr:sulfite oxidase-like oxidoreductase [Candidatus Saccharimonas sp.]